MNGDAGGGGGGASSEDNCLLGLHWRLTSVRSGLPLIIPAQVCIFVVTAGMFIFLASRDKPRPEVVSEAMEVAICCLYLADIITSCYMFCKARAAIVAAYLLSNSCAASLATLLPVRLYTSRSVAAVTSAAYVYLLVCFILSCVCCVSQWGILIVLVFYLIQPLLRRCLDSLLSKPEAPPPPPSPPPPAPVEPLPPDDDETPEPRSPEPGVRVGSVVGAVCEWAFHRLPPLPRWMQGGEDEPVPPAQVTLRPAPPPRLPALPPLPNVHAARLPALPPLPSIRLPPPPAQPPVPPEQLPVPPAQPPVPPEQPPVPPEQQPLLLAHPGLPRRSTVPAMSLTRPKESPPGSSGQRSGSITFREPLESRGRASSEGSARSSLTFSRPASILVHSQQRDMDLSAPPASSPRTQSLWVPTPLLRVSLTGSLKSRGSGSVKSADRSSLSSMEGSSIGSAERGSFSSGGRNSLGGTLTLPVADVSEEEYNESLKSGGSKQLSVINERWRKYRDSLEHRHRQKRKSPDK